MRKTAYVLFALFACGIAGTVNVSRAQDTTVLPPDQATQKAKQIIQQAIEALGGQAYLSVRDVTYEGRMGTFDHSGQLTGFEKFVDYERPPDKERQENLPKRNIVQIYNGKEGWEMDRGGVQDAPEDSLANFQEDQKRDIDNILRNRIHEPDMNFHYAGPDVVELKEVDWVELDDSDDRQIRIAFSQSAHLPIQETVTTRDPQSRLRIEEVNHYSNYQQVEGVTTPFQILRERNNMKVFQVFFDDVKYNTDIPDSLFTKESLDERWSHIGKNERKKEKKEKEKEDKYDQDNGNNFR